MYKFIGPNKKHIYVNYGKLTVADFVTKLIFCLFLFVF